jgi:hypothetical protein
MFHYMNNKQNMHVNICCKNIPNIGYISVQILHMFSLLM